MSLDQIRTRAVGRTLPIIGVSVVVLELVLFFGVSQLRSTLSEMLLPTYYRECMSFLAKGEDSIFEPSDAGFEALSRLVAESRILVPLESEELGVWPKAIRFLGRQMMPSGRTSPEPEIQRIYLAFSEEPATLRIEFERRGQIEVGISLLARKLEARPRPVSATRLSVLVVVVLAAHLFGGYILFGLGEYRIRRNNSIRSAKAVSET